MALAQRIDPIAKSPLLSMTPDSMTSQIATAASGARREDARPDREPVPGGEEPAQRIGPEAPGLPAQANDGRNVIALEPGCRSGFVGAAKGRQPHLVGGCALAGVLVRVN